MNHKLPEKLTPWEGPDLNQTEEQYMALVKAYNDKFNEYLKSQWRNLPTDEELDEHLKNIPDDIKNQI